jgi:hypothetical protein
MRRCIGLDVHREFARVAIWEDGVIWQPVDNATRASKLSSVCSVRSMRMRLLGGIPSLSQR